MKIEVNNRNRGVSYGSLNPGDVFTNRPTNDALGYDILMKSEDDACAMSLKSGGYYPFEDEEIVYPLDATLVINE